MYRLMNPHFKTTEISTIASLAIIKNGLKEIDEILIMEEELCQFYIKKRKRIRASLNAHLNDDLKFIELAIMLDKHEEVTDEFGKDVWYSLRQKKKYEKLEADIMTELCDILDTAIKRDFMHHLIRAYAEKLLA